MLDTFTEDKILTAVQELTTELSRVEAKVNARGGGGAKFGTPSITSVAYGLMSLPNRIEGFTSIDDLDGIHWYNLITAVGDGVGVPVFAESVHIYDSYIEAHTYGYVDADGNISSTMSVSGRVLVLDRVSLPTWDSVQQQYEAALTIDVVLIAEDGVIYSALS